MCIWAGSVSNGSIGIERSIQLYDTTLSPLAALRLATHRVGVNHGREDDAEILREWKAVIDEGFVEQGDSMALLVRCALAGDPPELAPLTNDEVRELTYAAGYFDCMRAFVVAKNNGFAI